MKKILVSFLMIMAFVFQSCSVEKRHYRDGYYFTFNKAHADRDKAVDATTSNENSFVQVKMASASCRTNAATDNQVVTGVKTTSSTIRTSQQGNYLLCSPSKLLSDTDTIRRKHAYAPPPKAFPASGKRSDDFTKIFWVIAGLFILFVLALIVLLFRIIFNI